MSKILLLLVLFAPSAMLIGCGSPPTEGTDEPLELTGRLAFSTIRNGLWDVYVADFDHGTVTAAPGLHTELARESGAIWSPDGTRLAVSIDLQLWLIDDDGSNLMRVLPSGTVSSGYTWRPDGNEVAYSSSIDGVRAIWVVSLADTSQRRVVARAAVSLDNPQWSPDGRYLVFDTDREIMTIDVAGGSPAVSLVNDGGSGAVSDPTWSPDGNQIAYTRTLVDGFSQIAVVTVADRSVETLTSGETVDSRPAWSPDGSMLAFERTFAPGTFEYEIWVISADGAREERIESAGLQDRDPSWTAARPPGPN